MNFVTHSRELYLVYTIFLITANYTELDNRCDCNKKNSMNILKKNLCNYIFKRDGVINY